MQAQALCCLNLGIGGPQPMRERSSALSSPQPHRILASDARKRMQLHEHGAELELDPRCGT